MLLMSTNSSGSLALPNTRREERNAGSRRFREILRKLTAGRISVRCHSGSGGNFRETLQHQSRAIFGNVEAHLDIRALDIHLGRLCVEEKIRVRQFEETLRLVTNPGRQLPGR